MAQATTAETNGESNPTHQIEYREVEDVRANGQRTLGRKQSVCLDAIVETESVLEGIDESGRRLIVPLDDREVIWAQDRQSLDVIDVVGVCEQIMEVA